MRLAIPRRNSIAIDQPFPDAPALFPNLGEFFEQAAQKSRTTGPYGQPVLNVETHYVDKETLCSVCPFTVELAAVPGFAWQRSVWMATWPNGLPCDWPAILIFPDAEPA